jgi:hypothetical protein
MSGCCCCVAVSDDPSPTPPPFPSTRTGRASAFRGCTDADARGAPSSSTRGAHASVADVVGQRAAAAGPAVRGLPGTALKSVPTPLSLELPPRADTSSGAARDVDRACQALCRVSDKLAAKRRGIEDELLQSHASVELLRSLLRVVAPPDDDDDDSQSRREEEADALAAASHGRPHFHHFIADEVLRSASEIVQRSCGSFRAAFSASLQTLTDLRRVLDGVGETLDRIHAGDALTLGLPEPALQPQPQPSSSPTSCPLSRPSWPTSTPPTPPSPSP